MKVLVKEGWVNQTPVKKSEPRIQFMLIQYLQDVLDDFKKTDCTT
jgi:DNA polymerase-3 subunit alpha